MPRYTLYAVGVKYSLHHPLFLKITLRDIHISYRSSFIQLLVRRLGTV